MKITQLDLVSFRSFVGESIPLNFPRVYISGVNGAGKTTIREAIKWAFTGRCEVTDAKGAGSELLVPDGLEDATVSLALDGLGTIRRNHAPSGSAFTVEGFTGSSVIQQGALYGKLGINPAFLDAVLDTDVFVRLHHGDAKALVLALLDVKVTYEGKEQGLDALEALYKQAFEDRKIAKRNLQNYRRPEIPKMPEKPYPTIDAINAQMAKLQAQLNEARKGIGETVGQRRAYQQELDRLDTSVPPKNPKREERILELETVLAGADDFKTPPPEGKGDAVKIVFLRNQIEALTKHVPKNGCVLDKNVQCKTPLSQFTSRAEFLQADVDRLVDAQGEIVPPSLSVSEQRRELATLRQAQAVYEAKVQNNQDNVRRVEELHAKVQALPDTKAQEEAIALLEQRIALGQALLRDVTAYHAAVKEHQQGAVRQKELEDYVAQEEKRCEDLGPNGVRLQALKDAVEGFETEINGYLQAWEFTVAFQVEPWQVMVNNRPFQTYSKSERWRIAMGIQLAIAQFSGLNFAILDEVDMLDKAAREDLMNLVLDHAHELDQILVLATRDRDRPLPQAEGMISYRLDFVDGKSKVIESAIWKEEEVVHG